MTNFIVNNGGAPTDAPVGAGIINVLLANNLSNWGATGNGSTDDTAAVIAAVAGCNGTLVVGAGTYKITSLVTFTNITLLVSPGALFTGTGSIAGVLNNDDIPHAAFQVPYNLVTQKERSPNVSAGSYYVDPLLGSDANAGTAIAPFATIAQTLTQIASVAATFGANMTIVMRSGRHEVAAGGITMTSSHTLTGGFSVTWVNNTGERPYITAPTKWFFKSSPVAATYNNFVGVANPLGYDFQDLYDAETGLPIDCANNMGPNYSLPRNQSTNVTLSGSSGSYKLSITLTAADEARFNLMTSTEQAGVRLRTTQWFTSNWLNGLTISGATLTGNCSNALQAQGPNNYNGWASLPVDAYGCMYLLMNLKTSLNGNNFCGFSDHVWLPTKGSNYFTVDNTTIFLIKTGAAKFHYFEGIGFRYLAAGMSTLSTLVTNIYPSGAGPTLGASNLGFLVGGVGTSGATSCDFSYGNMNACQTCGGTTAGGGGGTYSHNTVNFVGLAAFMPNLLSNGSDNVTITYNTIRRWGHFSSVWAPGIVVGGVSATVQYNDLREGTAPAIEVSSNVLLQTPGLATSAWGGSVQYNVALDCGYVNNAQTDYLMSDDQGVIYCQGGVTFAGYVQPSYTIDQNVLGRLYTASPIRGHGIMLDGGCQNWTVTNNLCWGQPSYSLLVNQVGTSTFNNTFNNNIFLGAVTFPSTLGSTASSFNNNAVAATSGNSVPQNGVTGSLTTTGTFYGGFGCEANGQYPVIDSNDWMNQFDSVFTSTFIRSFIQRKSFVTGAGNGSAVYYPTALTTAGITAAAVQCAQAGGGIVKLPAQTITLTGTLPQLANVIYEGSGWTVSPTPLLTGGTILQGNGTFPGIAANNTDLGSVYGSQALLLASCISNTGARNIGFSNFTYAMKCGALYQGGPSYGIFKNCFAQNCTAWGFWFENFSHCEFKDLIAYTNANGLAFMGSGTSLYNFGNSTISGMVGGGNATAGVQGRNVWVGARKASSLNDISLIGGGAGGPTSNNSQTATLTGTVSAIAVTDLTKYAPGMPVQFTSGVGNLTQNKIYFVLTVSGSSGAGTITICTSMPSSVAIVPSTSGTPTLTSYGYPMLDIGGADSGSLVTYSSWISNVDLEGGITVLQGISGFTLDGGIISSGAIADICIRSSSNVTLNLTEPGMNLDLDVSSTIVNGSAPNFLPYTSALGLRKQANGRANLNLSGNYADDIVPSSNFNGWLTYNIGLAPYSTQQSASGTLTINSNMGNVIMLTAGGGTIVLPNGANISVNTVPWQILICNPTASACAVNAGGSTAITGSGATGTTATLAAYTSAQFTLLNNAGTLSWAITGGGALPSIPSFIDPIAVSFFGGA